MIETNRVLDDALARCSTVVTSGRTPVVVFDLDGTLFDNGPRTWQILVDFAEDQGDSALRRALDKMPRTGLPYLLGETLARVGAVDPALIQRCTAFWRQRFFTDEYQRYDEPVPGAVAFARASFDAGATVVYLSGRDAPGMLVGVAASLRQHGFPVGLAHTAIVLKHDFDTPDLDFKKDALKFIDSLGSVVASFDNEPANCNLFLARWPEATVGLVDTHHAPDPPALAAGVVTLPDFSRT
jgi:hypothetical protein